MSEKMTVVAVTGGFGTGKTTVASMFKELGAHIVDVDRIVFELEKPHQTAWKKIVGAFGAQILKPDETIDRPRLAALVFGNPNALQKLNQAVHPLVLSQTKTAIDAARKNGISLVVVDIPLLFEVSWRHQFDYTIVVTASDETVLERIQKNRHLSAVEINQRIKSQLPLEQKVQCADFVVNNDAGLSFTKKQAQAVFDKIKNG